MRYPVVVPLPDGAFHCSDAVVSVTPLSASAVGGGPDWLRVASSERLNEMSLLVALFWWISTARVFVPATSRAGLTGNANHWASSAPPTAVTARVAGVMVPAGRSLRATSVPLR